MVLSLSGPTLADGDRPDMGDAAGYFEAVCVGETMALVVPAVAEPLSRASEFRIWSGGAESKVAMYLAALGHRAAWVGVLGDDPLGRRVLADVATAGVDVSRARLEPGAQTGVYFKDPSPQGTEVYYYRAASAARSMSASLLEPFVKVPPRLLYVSGITPALSPPCHRLAQAVLVERRVPGSVVAFDVNFRPALWAPHAASPVLLELCRSADVVFVGLDEANLLWGVSNAEEVHDLVHGPRSLVVKDGPNGATAFEDGPCYFVPALRHPVREVVGAGDAFAAGWLAGLLRGLPETQRLRLGHLAAASALATTSDFGVLPKWEVLSSVITAPEGGWPPDISTSLVNRTGR